MAKKKFINFIVAPEDRSGTLTVRVRLGAFYVLMGAASLVFVAVVALVMNQAMDEAKLGELEFLRNQNGELKEKVSRIAGLEKKLTELEVVEDKLMVMAGEREAAREMKPVSVEPGAGGEARTLTIGDGWQQWRALTASKRSVTVNGPEGDPVARGWITRGFGEQAGLEGIMFHHGVDIAVATGTPVKATGPGVVIFAGDDPTYGKLVIIQHALTGYATFYGHNSALKVKVGDQVKRDDVVALSGNTGKSTAPHLHYEVRLHGVPVNPVKYMTPAETGGEEPLPAIEEPGTAQPAPTKPVDEKEGGIPTGQPKAGSAEAPPGP